MALTLEELLAAPAEHYMNQDQLEFFRRLLATEREQLLKTLPSHAGAILVDEQYRDPCDHAGRETLRSIDTRMLSRNQQMIRKIEEAMSRIDSGDFGYCHETGEPIGIKRLLARPTTTLTVEAKERQEAAERHRRKQAPLAAAPIYA